MELTPGPATERQIARLESILQELQDFGSDTPEGLMRDHLTEAHYYLGGSMPREYELNMSLARALAPRIADAGLRERLERVLNLTRAA
jgi:hypothetical protein